MCCRHDFSCSTFRLLVNDLLTVFHYPADQHQCEGPEKGATIEMGVVHVCDLCVYLSQCVGTICVEPDGCSYHLDSLRSRLHPFCLQIVHQSCDAVAK